METTTNLLFFLVIISASFWGWTLLRISFTRLQHSSYRPERYLRRLFGRDTSLFFKDLQPFVLLFAGVLAGLFLFGAVWVRVLGCVIALAFFTISATRNRKSYLTEKKPFVYTQRSTRLALASIGLLLLPLVLMFLLYGLLSTAVVAVLWASLAPLSILLANAFLAPLEQQVNGFYFRDAVRKRKGLSGLLSIGITGSYGKTSTKHFVQGILSRRFLSYMTPGSVNTDLGLAREVREKLKPIHEIFVAEMGAREPGDIGICCQVAQPKWGILTCVGKAHLETFGSEEAIRRTKGELLESLPEDGIAFLNANDPNTEQMKSFAKCRTVLFGLAPCSADVFARDIQVTHEGSMFWVDGDSVETPFQLQTQLLGRHNISNLMSAVAVALEMQMVVPVIQAAVQTLRPVEHRLQLLKKSNGVLVIDDAFNSNPEGFREALDTLSLFQEHRRVLVTPGMVELGEAEIEENRSIGKYAAARVDHVVLVGTEQRVAPLLEGLLENGFLRENVLQVPSLGKAREHLAVFNKPGDIVLFENDLPDLYG